MSLINQRNVKLVVFTFSLFNALYFVYGLSSMGFTPGALFDFFLFQWVLIVFYMLYVSSVKWFNERTDESLEQSNAQFKNTDTKLSAIIEAVTQAQRSVEVEVKQASANSMAVKSQLEELQTKIIQIQEQGNTKLEMLNKIKSEFESIRSAHEATSKTVGNDLRELGDSLSQELTKLTESTVSGNKLLVDLPSLIKKSAAGISDTQSRSLEKQYGRIDALLAIYNFLDPNLPLPIMNDWAISSDYAHVLIGRFMSQQQKTVVDVGSGISTLLLAYMAKLKGEGKVLSLEHDENYKKQTEEQLRLHGVEDFAIVHYCPIVSYDINGEEWLWYDTSKLSFEDITLLSVDGPPGKLQKMSRYPAVPLLIESIRQNADILLDDAYREDEKLITDRWVKEYGFEYKQFTTHKGTNCFIKL